MGIFSLIDSEEKRRRLGFLGTGAAMVIVALWTAFVYFYPPKTDTKPSGTSVTVKNTQDRQREADAELQWQTLKGSDDSLELSTFEQQYRGTYYGNLAKARLKNLLGPSQDGWTLSGDYLKYYPSPSPGACRLDCGRIPSDCKGFTWVRPGGYREGDSPMCYLMTTVQYATQHTCCVSATRGPFPFP